MNETRQRNTDVARARRRAVAVGLGTLGVLLGAVACGQAVPAVPDAAATAIAAAPTLAAGAQTSANSAQTAVAGAQTAVAVVQTVVPGAQATVQAGATLATGVLANPQLLGQIAGVMLGGATVTVQLTPADATGDAVEQASLDAIDTTGSFGRLDASVARQSATNVLAAAAQLFPQAIVSLTVKDPTGRTLLTGSKAPGAEASITQ